MPVIKFNDGTPPKEGKILLKAESCIVLQSEGCYYIINRSKVDESEGEPEIVKSKIATFEEDISNTEFNSDSFFPNSTPTGKIESSIDDSDLFKRDVPINS